MANKRKKNNNRLLKFQLRTRAALRITPLLLAIALAGNWALDTFGGEIKSMIGYGNLRDQVGIEIPFGEAKAEEGTEDDLIFDDPTESTEDVEDKYDREYPDFRQDNEEERISSTLLDEGYDFDPVDFGALRQINEDTVAWITVPGTGIDFPIVQGESNNEYLKTDFNGNKSSMGSIFLDYRNNSLDNKEYDLSDISLVYGHHMSGGRMFAPLCNYKSQSYYDNHKTGIVYTADGMAMEIEFFAGVIIDGTDETVLFQSDFVDEQDYANYWNNIRRNSTFDSDVELEYGDKVIALVTCSYETNNSRYVLYGVMNKQIINENQRDYVTEGTKSLG